MVTKRQFHRNMTKGKIKKINDLLQVERQKRITTLRKRISNVKKTVNKRSKPIKKAIRKTKKIIRKVR